jgi:8-oxo-dGTP pyrophosphatase MutT (NUDIX family)
MNINECVESYEIEASKRRAEMEADEIEKCAQEEAATREAFEEIGLTPVRVEGRSAFFEYEGEEIHFVFVNWRYGFKAFYRIIGQCPDCEGALVSGQFEINEENIGRAVSAPDVQYHSCDIYRAAKPVETVEKSARDLFMDALDQYLRSQITFKEF